MFWFKNRKREEQATVKNEVEAEVAAHKKQSRKVVEQAKRATNRANRIIEENGFTVKIFTGMGGRDPKQKLHKAGTH